MTEIEEIQYQAFRTIRQKINDFLESQTLNNDEIAGFVKGICAYEKNLCIEIETRKSERGA